MKSRAFVHLAALFLAILPSAAVSQRWDGPHQLTSATADDINPSTCKEFLYGTTCLVWQSLVGEAWNIHSRFGFLYNGNSWEDELRVTLDSSVDNVNPAVACLNDSLEHPGFCCVWEQRQSPLGGSIWAAFGRYGDSWGPPVMLGSAIHTDSDSAMPNIITIEGDSADTVWVIWRSHDTSGTYISYTFHAGDSWSEPQVVVAGDPRHARLGRLHGGWTPGQPLLVWEQADDIFYSIYEAGAWTTPAHVAYSPGDDRSPDVVSNGGEWNWLGSYVVWESTRDGDTAVYITEPDSFSVGQRACDSAAGTNLNPAGANFMATTLDDWWCFVAWVTDRNGNPDIYTSYESHGSEYWVDLDSADDLAPVVTSMGNGCGAQMAWVLWQSNRTGNWDIFGGFVFNSGVEESHKPQASSSKLAATVLRRLPAGTVAFDAMGRRVTDPNPGIYFVRLEPSAASREPSAVGVRKVVVQR